MIYGFKINKLILPLLLCLAVIIPLGLINKEKETLLISGGLLVVFTAILAVELKLQKWMFYALALVIPFSLEVNLVGGMNVFFPSEPLLVIAGFSILYEVVKQDIRELKRSTIDILLALLIGWFFITSYFSDYPDISLKYSLVYSTYLIVFYYYSKRIFSSSFPIQKWLTILMIGIGIISLYSIFRSAEHGFITQTSRIISRPFFKDHTIMGAALGFSIPITTGLLFYYKKQNRWSVPVFSLLLIAMLINLWLGHSRAAWLSIIASLVLVIPFYFRIPAKIISIFLISALGTGIYFASEIQDQFLLSRADSGKNNANLFEETQSITNIQSDVSNLERINRWNAAIRMQEERPLLGFGPGTYQYTYIPFQDERDKTRISIENPYWVKDMHGGTAHSEPFLMLAELGWPGLTFWLLICMYCIYLYMQRLRYGPIKKIEIEDWVLVALLGFLIHALVNNYLNTDKIAIFFWGGIAILESWRLTKVKKNESEV